MEKCYSTNEVLPSIDLLESTYYRLKVSTDCETEYTDTILVRVNPLPVVPYSIEGRDSVCYHQYEKYVISDRKTGYTYAWSLINNEGIFTSETTNVDTVEIYWQNRNSNDTIVLSVTDNKTNCENIQKQSVHICDEEASGYNNYCKKAED